MTAAFQDGLRRGATSPSAFPDSDYDLFIEMDTNLTPLQRSTAVHRLFPRRRWAMACRNGTSEAPFSMASISIEELLKLPPADRVEIALAPWDSLEDAEVDALLPLTDEQKAELDRRMVEHERDPDSGIPWEQVRRDLFDPE